MVSTPSRSRQATRISLPDIVGPSSTVLPARAFLLISVVLLICLLCLWLAAAGAQKSPRPFASRGLLSKLSLPSTSAYGVANYDDGQQGYLSNVHYHGRECSKTGQGRQALRARHLRGVESRYWAARLDEDPFPLTLL